MEIFFERNGKKFRALEIIDGLVTKEEEIKDAEFVDIPDGGEPDILPEHDFTIDIIN